MYGLSIINANSIAINGTAIFAQVVGTLCKFLAIFYAFPPHSPQCNVVKLPCNCDTFYKSFISKCRNVLSIKSNIVLFFGGGGG